MPQGKIVEIGPFIPEEGIDVGQDDKDTCKGYVEILDDKVYKGQILPFKETGQCCRCAKETEVTVDIMGIASGRPWAKITKCPKCE